MTWHDIELIWVEYLKTKDENIYKEYRKLAIEFAIKTWGENYESIFSNDS